MTPSAGAAETGTVACAGAMIGERTVAGPASMSTARNFESSFELRRIASLLLATLGLSRFERVMRNRDCAWSRCAARIVRALVGHSFGACASKSVRVPQELVEKAV